MKAVFHPFWSTIKTEDLLGFSHAWLGERFVTPLRKLKSAGKFHGIEMAGTGFSDHRDADIFFFWERPRIDDDVFHDALYTGRPMVLLATEPITTLPMNGFAENLMLFDHIFSWYMPLAKRVQRIRPITFEFPKDPLRTPFVERKLCVMVASIYTRENDPNELYSKRAEAVRWFVDNHIDEMDFFGRQNRFTDTRFKIYRGPINDKLQVLSQYKYQICYENSNGVKGYISEKIFDAFFAGCIPVYWGCEDVKDYIPEGCFLDKRDYHSYDTLYEKMHSIDEEEYNAYMERIAAFLQSSFAQSYNEYALSDILLPICFGID